MGNEWTHASLFEVFGDDLVREILVMASEGPVSAETIADHAEASKPTVYRRLDTLEELELVEADRRVDPDGNHYREFVTTVKRIAVEIEDGGVEIDLRIRRDVSDRFEAFWSELEETSRGVDAARTESGVDQWGDSSRG